MELKRVLFVGGAKAPYHLLEPAIEPVSRALNEIGLNVTTAGIYHPQSPETPEGDYTALSHQNLQHYDALVLFTTGQGNGEDIDAVLEFVRSGKALIGI